MSHALVCYSSKAFLPDSRIQVIWDSTSLGLAKTCQRKYYYTMIAGWAPKSTPLPLTFGILYHEAFQWFDQAQAKGMSVETALIFTLRLIHAKTYNWDSPDSYRNRETLVRAIVWYVEQFRDDPCTTVILADGNPAVELSFKYQVPDFYPLGEPIFFSGHLDRLVTMQEKLWILDKKTTTFALSGFYFDKYSPDNQMSFYTLAGKILYSSQISGAIIDAVQLGVGFNRYQRHIVSRTESQLLEWLDNTKATITNILSIAESSDSHLPHHWAMNDTACDKFGGCAFRETCSRSPEVRQAFLSADFQQKLWDPAVPRDAGLPPSPQQISCTDD